MLRCLIILLALVSLITLPALAEDEARLLRMPAVSDNHVAFVYAGDIWITGQDPIVTRLFAQQGETLLDDPGQGIPWQQTHK